MPGLRFKLWPIFGVKKFPWVQVPAGEIGVVIAQVGAAAADRRQERRVQARVRQLLRPRGVHRRRRAEGCAAPGAPAGNAAARSTRSRSWCITSRKVYGLTVSPDLVERVRGAGGVLAAGDVRAHARAAAGRRDRAGRSAGRGRHRHRARRRAAAARATSRAGSAGYDDIAAMEHAEGTIDSRDHRGAARQQEHAAQQLPGLPDVPRRRRQDRSAARPVAVRRVPAEPVPGRASTWCRCSS